MLFSLIIPSVILALDIEGKQKNSNHIQSLVTKSEMKFAFEEVNTLRDGANSQIQIPIVYKKNRVDETLWDIAEKIRPQFVTVEQMMLAIQRENPQVFIDNNLSQLKTDVVIRIDDEASLTKLSPQEAIFEVSRQHKEWLASQLKSRSQDVVVLKPLNVTHRMDLNDGQLESTESVTLVSFLNEKNMEVISALFIFLLLPILVYKNERFKDLFIKKSISVDQIQYSLKQLFPAKIDEFELDNCLANNKTMNKLVNVEKSSNERGYDEPPYYKSALQKSDDNTLAGLKNNKYFVNENKKDNEVSGEQVIATLGTLRKLLDQKKPRSKFN